MTQVLVPRSLMTQITAQVSGKAPVAEAGGLLLGHRKGDAIELTQLTFPTRWDRATSTRFERSALGHRIAALRAWKQSHGTIDWVGEWHTHPFGSPNPSFIDQTSWRKIARHSKRPMAFIIGGKCSVFIGVQELSSHRVIKLEKLECNDEFELFGSD
jgi:integrative and conjugative element protein (TIGR02256 family)